MSPLSGNLAGMGGQTNSSDQDCSAYCVKKGLVLLAATLPPCREAAAEGN